MKKAKHLKELSFFGAFWIKWICFHNFIMKVCVLMLNQMLQIQDVINTPCVDTYDKSEVKKNKFFNHQDVGTYQMEHQPAYASDCWDGLLVPIFSHAPQWFCFLMANMVSKRRLALWGGKQNISGGPEGWARRYIRQLARMQMFYALLEHFCTQKSLRKKLIAGMFVQTSSQYF